MIEPIEKNLLGSLSTPSTPTPGQTSFSDLIQGMEETAGPGSTEAALLEDWNDQLAGEQGPAAQRADNSNTGSIDQGQMI